MYLLALDLKLQNLIRAVWLQFSSFEPGSNFIPSSQNNHTVSTGIQTLPQTNGIATRWTSIMGDRPGRTGH
jgi:hypothetical protein